MGGGDGIRQRPSWIIIIINTSKLCISICPLFENSLRPNNFFSAILANIVPTPLLPNSRRSKMHFASSLHVCQSQNAVQIITCRKTHPAHVRQSKNVYADNFHLIYLFEMICVLHMLFSCSNLCCKKKNVTPKMVAKIFAATNRQRICVRTIRLYWCTHIVFGIHIQYHTVSVQSYIEQFICNTICNMM